MAGFALTLELEDSGNEFRRKIDQQNKPAKNLITKYGRNKL